MSIFPPYSCVTAMHMRISGGHAPSAGTRTNGPRFAFCRHCGQFITLHQFTRDTTRYAASILIQEWP